MARGVVPLSKVIFDAMRCYYSNGCARKRRAPPRLNQEANWVDWDGEADCRLVDLKRDPHLRPNWTYVVRRVGFSVEQCKARWQELQDLQRLQETHTQLKQCSLTCDVAEAWASCNMGWFFLQVAKRAPAHRIPPDENEQYVKGCYLATPQSVFERSRLNNCSPGSASLGLLELLPRIRANIIRGFSGWKLYVGLLLSFLAHQLGFNGRHCSWNRTYPLSPISTCSGCTSP